MIDMMILNRNRFGSRHGVIQAMGAKGAGMGVCAPGYLPDGMIPTPGCGIVGSETYGNYIYKGHSVYCFIPKFYYKITTNTIDIKGIDTYADTATANTAGYALHRAFIDGGSELSGVFVMKYMASQRTYGGDAIAASVRNGLPISAHADHNPIASLTACSANQYHEAINAAKAIGTGFFCSSRFIYSALAMLATAHGQACSSTTNCAWYHATNNYPKGCNNNARKDTDDTSVVWESDGYGNCGKTGSAGYGGGAGNEFAKSTHNGQMCGVADLNGLMWEVSIGMTCIATSPAIEGMSQANPCVITITGHGLVNGNIIQVNAITQADWSGCKDKMWTVTKINDDTFSIPFDSSGFGTAYDAGTDPGTITKGTFYVAKEATAMKDFTSGTTGAADHWGATGVAAMMDAFSPPFETSGGGAYAQRMGSGANQVLSEATSGAGWVLTGLGFPKDADGVDTTGTSLFGKDHFYQYIINACCLRSCGRWTGSSEAGVWASSWIGTRASSNNDVGCRASCYPGG